MLRGENVENVGELGCGPKERDRRSPLVRWCLMQYSYVKCRAMQLENCSNRRGRKLTAQETRLKLPDKLRHFLLRGQAGG